MSRLRHALKAFAYVIIACAISGMSGLPQRTSAADNDDPYAQAQILAGQWVRPDGGYRLVIDEIRPDGSVKASYYNPKKINVEKAAWSIEGGAPRVFVELRDVNYPGSTYNLTYVNEHDVLGGIYFHALQKQAFEVLFLRMAAD